MKLNTLLAASAAFLIAGSANAAYHQKDVVRDARKQVVVNTFKNCVITKWDNTYGTCGGFNKTDLTVYFDFNKDVLTAESKAKLNALAAKLEGSNVTSASIVGFADEIGADAYNVALSERRAAAVERYLDARTSVNISVAKVRGLGETSSKTACEGVTNRAEKIACLAEDRRVEIELGLGR